MVKVVILYEEVLNEKNNYHERLYLNGSNLIADMKLNPS
jgi:hypothetical protein